MIIKMEDKNTQYKRGEVSVIKKVTLVGFWINAVLVAVKLFFGYWGHSDALVADGYHSFSDFITDFIVLFFVGIAYKKADTQHPYGHGKYETIASVLIGAILMLVSIFICVEGITSIIKAVKGEILQRPDIWTMIVAIISILTKEFCYRYTIRAGQKIDSSALIANAWHHRSDAISSIATLIGISLSFFLGEQWRVLDPIASVIISVFIGISAVQIALPSINELLEISLPENQIKLILDIIRNVPGVKHAHNLKSRKNGHSYIIDVNIHVDPDITVRLAHEIANDVEQELYKSFKQDMIIYVHIEPDT